MHGLISLGTIYEDIRPLSEAQETNDSLNHFSQWNKSFICNAFPDDLDTQRKNYSNFGSKINLKLKVIMSLTDLQHICSMAFFKHTCLHIYLGDILVRLWVVIK